MVSPRNKSLAIGFSVRMYEELQSFIIRSFKFLFKTGVGNFSYDKDVRPHAVTEVENTDGKIPGDALTTSFNDLGKSQLIEDAGKNLGMDFVYVPRSGKMVFGAVAQWYGCQDNSLCRGIRKDYRKWQTTRVLLP